MSATLLFVQGEVRSDLEAFEDLWVRVHEPLRQRARRLLRTAADADDAAEETLTRLWRRWPELRNHPNLDGWVFTTCCNVCFEVLRKRRRWEPLLVDRRLALDESRLERPALLQAVMTLTARQRDVVMARYWFDLSVAETAALLGRSEGQVRTAAEEGLRRLRSRIDVTELVDQ
jgi:RNA polymerase sigma factor (sigma-70 family)